MMTPKALEGNDLVPSKINRRSAIRSTLAATVATSGLSAAAHSRAAPDAADPRRASPKTYRMKKSINLWAFPYPQRMTPARVPPTRQGCRVRRHRAELRPRQRPLAQGRPPKQFQAIRKMAEEIGIAISGLCSFLYWPYSLTDNDSVAARPGPRAGPADDRGRPRAGHREPADDRRLDLHPLAARPRAGADRRLRPPRPRGDRPSCSPWPRSAAST